MKSRRMLGDVQTILACVTTGALAIVALKVALGPTALPLLKMKLAKSAETLCMNNAMVWASAADIAANAYDNARAVTL